VAGRAALQRSEHFDVRIGQVTVRVPTEDFQRRARGIRHLVQKIGAEWRGPNG
jgi:hypothetical protein